MLIYSVDEDEESDEDGELEVTEGEYILPHTHTTIRTSITAEEE